MRNEFFFATAAVVLLTSGPMTAAASTTTTPASGGTNVSADVAQNGVTPAFTTLGSMVITEASNNDFRTTGTLILTAPSGWQFNPAAAITATPGKVGGGSTANDISASVGAVSATEITVNLTVSATARLDNLTLSGIQVQAVEGGALPVAGNILRSSANPGTATIVGVTNDATNFGSLSQAAGALRLFVVLPGQSFTDGSTVAASGVSGAAPNQAAGVAFNLSELVAADREFNVAATYSGAKTIAYAGAGGSPSFTTNVSFTGGHSTTALATTLRKAETVALSATSATAPAIATALPSASFSVAPGPVSKLQLLLPGETAAPGTATGKTGTPVAQTAGAAMLNNVRVNAVDADWNVIASASPDVAIGSSDAAAAIADDNGATGGNLSLVAGSGTLSSFTFWTGGAPQTLSATDAAAALSAGTSASVTVNKAPSATGVTSSQNPATFGQSVTFTATVTGGMGTPSGTVNFKDGSTVIGNAIALDGSGVASFTPASLTAATHTITAVYSGNALYNTSTSANLAQVVNKASTATALVSSLNPTCAGQPVTLTATVSVVAPGAGVPAGTVNFKDGSTVIGSNIALNGSAVATFTTSALSSANHNLTAVYNGNSSFNTSTSSPALVETVHAKPTASVSGSTSICTGGSAAIQAALGGTSPWTVTWSDGLVQSGVTTSPASRSVSPAATTTFSVTSVVDAFCSNTGSGSATVTVNALPAISAQPAPKNVCAGSTATFTVTASGAGLTYRWRKDGVNLVNGGHVAGATSALLTISSAAAADAGSYDVVVSGTCPPALTSNAASLTVNPIPNATITAASLLCAGSPGNAASVPDAGAGASYAWTISNGSITGGAATPIVSYTAGASGNSMTLNVTVTSPNGCGASSSKVVSLSTGGVAIEDWKNIPAGTESWQSATLQTKDMTYPEGGTIPYRLTLPQPCVGSTWSITLQYDFVDVSSGAHFCDFLTSYNAYEGSVNGQACAGRTCTGESTFPIPADGDLSYQMPGVFTVENGTITGTSAYTTTLAGGSLSKQVTLTGTATSGADVMILFGAHLARDYEWGADRGAHEWPTGTGSLGFLDYSGGAGSSTAGHTNVKVSDNILDNPSQSDLAVVATDTPDPVNAGQNLTFSILVSNSGPLSSTADTLTDAVPAGTTFVSATAPSGWSMTTPAVGGTGTVRWILPTSFNAGANATFGMVVAVNVGAVGTVENTATLTSGNVDAYLFNNSSHTSTTIFGTCTMPSVAADPANVTVEEGADASFSVAATGAPAPAIQWQVMPSGGSSFSDVPGATGASLSFTAALAQNGNQYRVRFSNPCGSQFSAAATLTVNEPETVNEPNPTETPRLAHNAPGVSITGLTLGTTFVVGQPVTFTGSFTGTAGNSYTARWTIGGASVPGIVNNATGSVEASYTFDTPGTYSIKLTVTDQAGVRGSTSQAGGTEAKAIVYGAGSTPAVDLGRTLEFRLAQNTPNPFRNGTEIRFSLPSQSRVKLGVFDLAGRQVATLSDQVWEPGNHSLNWSGRLDGGALARGGVYIVQMVAYSTTDGGHYSSQQKMIRID